MTVQSPPKGQPLKIFLKRTKRRKKKRFEKPPKAAREGPKSLLPRKVSLCFSYLLSLVSSFHLVTKRNSLLRKRRKKDAIIIIIIVLFRSGRRRRRRSRRRSDVSELDRIEDGRVHGHLGRVDERVRVRVVRLGRRISRAETFQEDDDDDD